MTYIDFHVHIDFYDNPEKVIRYYEQKGIYALFVTNLPEIFKKHFYRYNNYKYIKLALGYHPELSLQHPFNSLCFNTYFKYTNYVGEVGLDFTTKNDLARQRQLKAFRHICNCIKSNAKILSIHSRKAEKEVLDILIEHNIKYAVFHWYTGNIKVLDKIVKQNYYFSVNYKMLESKKGRDILSKIPLNRILFETDGPLSKKNKRIICPQMLPSIYNEFNKFYGIKNFEELIFSNFKDLLLKRKYDEEAETLLEN